MSLRIAAVQPVTAFGPNSRSVNMENLERYVKEAAEDGAQLVCFPETYPGLWREPVDWTPVEDAKRIARAYAVHLVVGFAEPLDRAGRRCYNALALIGPDGEEIGRYRRTTPAHSPWLYKGGEYWDFEWVKADDLPVFETSLGRIGLLVCSEIYATELPRILAVKGAEILIMPAGLLSRRGGQPSPFGDLFHTWRVLAWARAIENLACTVVCTNVLSEEGEGLCMICSPEEILLESYDQGVHVVELDLDRVRWLRQQKDRLVEGGVDWRTKPGTLRDWRRRSVLQGEAALITTSSD